MMGKEHALVLANHRSDIDWLIGWVFAQRSGRLGSALAIMKKSSKFLPVIGWSMWFSEYLFLKRSWAKDESCLQRFKGYPQPFVGSFCRGLCLLKAKLLAASRITHLQIVTCSQKCAHSANKERHRRSLKDDDGHGSWWREADSLRLQRLAAQAKSFRPADDDDDDFSDAWNYI
ncbi:1-acyl-sn-glycerol-3-phosphate acyltransferase 2-like protein [Tanacetum coccineum]|uniref:1-acyl-sn-glycerol-3-phosphate acyltransferase 2-like protein n=1 Tax=Tanacetum coccineum TaxID=301880 RepID=A0ABQ5FH24_9ASTR